MRDVWEGMKLWSWISTPSLSPIPLPPCCKVKAAMSENGHFLCLSLCSEIFPPFHLLDKHSKPKEQLSDEKKQQFLPLFFPFQCHQFLTQSESPEIFSWEAASISDLPGSVLPARGCAGSEHPRAQEEGPLSYPLQLWRGEPLSCCNPAQEGAGLSLWLVWFKYQGYATADDGHKRGSLHQIQNKSRTPCKQHRGQVAKMCPLQPEHPLASWSYRAGEIFGSMSLNNLHTAAIAYWYTMEETTILSLFLWVYSWFSSSSSLASTDSRNYNFVVVYWITDNKNFRRRSSEPYRVEFSCSKWCNLNAD